MQLKYSNYVAFSHFHGKAVNNSGQFFISNQKNHSIWCLKNGVYMGYYIKYLVYKILESIEKSTF